MKKINFKSTTGKNVTVTVEMQTEKINFCDGYNMKVNINPKIEVKAYIDGEYYGSGKYEAHADVQKKGFVSVIDNIGIVKEIDIKIEAAITELKETDIYKNYLKSVKKNMDDAWKLEETNVALEAACLS